MEFILLASFVNKNQVEKFIDILYEEFLILKDKIFVFEIEDNNNEYLITYKVHKVDRNKVNKFFVGINTIHIHRKSGCIFSINALNRLIEENMETYNIANKNDVEISWEQYRNKFLIINQNKLFIKDLKKIDLNN